MNVSVVIATCGSEEWKTMGDMAMTDLPMDVTVIRVHEPNGTVSSARNAGIAKVTTDYVCVLDADDTIAADYFDFTPEADITATAISYRNRTLAMISKVWQHERGRRKEHAGDCIGECLLDGNYIHIGSIMKTSVAQAVAFREYPVYEDYAYWLEQYLAGATFARREESVYMAEVRLNRNHRNHSMPIQERNLVHIQIYEDLTGKKWSVR
jgi:glycosyltransferase involved in cell wall biosynthesis